MSARSWQTFASLRMSITPSIDRRSCIIRPGSVHRVRCFEVSWLHPHWGHLSSTFFSHNDILELHPHHPDTCFVTNVRNVFGYPAIAFSYPSHHTESKYSARTIFFSWKNFFAVAHPQNSSSSVLGDPVIFLPPISIHISSFGKVLSIYSPVLWAALSDFFARASTFILIRSFSEQSRHFLESSACDCTYLYFTVKDWFDIRFLKTRRRSACVWFVDKDVWDVFPWETTPLLLQSAPTHGIDPLYPVAAAFRIICVIISSNISPR